MTRCLTTFALGFLVSTAAVRADVNDKVNEMTPPADSKQFAMKAAEGNLLEIKLSQLAEQKAQSSEVKQFAQRMVTDHTNASTQLMSIAKQENLQIPSDLQGEAKECYQAFEKLNGPVFDKNYMLLMIKDHLHDIGMFQNEATNGTDQAIKSFASTTLPTLREHASMLRPVATAVGIPFDALQGGGAASGSGHTGAGDTAVPAGSRQTPAHSTGTGSGTGSGSGTGAGSSGAGGTNR